MNSELWHTLSLLSVHDSACKLCICACVWMNTCATWCGKHSMCKEGLAGENRHNVHWFHLQHPKNTQIISQFQDFQVELNSVLSSTQYQVTLSRILRAPHMCAPYSRCAGQGALLRTLIWIDLTTTLFQIWEDLNTDDYMTLFICRRTVCIHISMYVYELDDPWVLFWAA